jgi:hypothetical protein
VSEDLVCERCGRVVVVNATNFETFERMHWVCFHYEFEHGDGVDPDAACRDPACPSRQIDQDPPLDWLAERRNTEQ